MAIYVKGSSSASKICTNPTFLVKGFTKDSVTLSAYGYTDVTISTPSGYQFITCIDACSTGAVVPIYVDRVGVTSTTVRIWHPENSSAKCSVYVVCLYMKI